MHQFSHSSICLKKNDADKAFWEDITEELIDIIPGLTIEIWDRDVQKDNDRKVAAELKKALAPKTMAKTNEAVEKALAAEATKAKLSVEQFVRKTAETEATKVVQRIHKSQRKNYSGDARIHASTPTKNGRKSRKDSNASHPKSNKRRSDESDDESVASNHQQRSRKGRGKTPKSSKSSKSKQKTGEKQVQFKDGTKTSPKSAGI